MVNKSYLTHHLTIISTIFSLYTFEIFFIVPNDPQFFVLSTLYTMLVCICNFFWVFIKFCVPYSIPPVNNLLSCEQMALPNHRAEPEVATSLRSFLSSGSTKPLKTREGRVQVGLKLVDSQASSHPKLRGSNKLATRKLAREPEN